MTGDELLRVLGTLANPHRLRVVAALTEERNYVSQLARELGISRALLQVHLRKLEAAGLVSADIEVSADGKAMKFYEVTPFAVLLTPEVIEAATRTLTATADLPASSAKRGLAHLRPHSLHALADIVRSCEVSCIREYACRADLSS
jgi:predicted transcriptional regulator